MTLSEIRKYARVRIYQEDRSMLVFTPYERVSSEEIEMIRSGIDKNKAAIMAELYAEEEEKEKEAARLARLIRFWVVGWETHEAWIDPEGDIEEQIKEIADKWRCDGATVDIVRKAYNGKIEKIAKEEEKKKAEAERVKQIFETAAKTGEKQLLHKYMDECNDPKEECSTDFVYIYAMPDGTKTTERCHTW